MMNRILLPREIILSITRIILITVQTKGLLTLATKHQSADTCQTSEDGKTARRGNGSGRCAEGYRVGSGVGRGSGELGTDEGDGRGARRVEDAVAVSMIVVEDFVPIDVERRDVVGAVADVIETGANTTVVDSASPVAVFDNGRL
jgi:hypothetical protein